MRRAAREPDHPSLVAVFAHPDDESLACGGTLARLADSGWNVILVCASRGERGLLAESPSPTWDGDVGAVRARELEAAAQVLGLGAIHLLAHPDGNLRWAAGAALRKDILSVLRRYRPDAVITFDDDGLYWHEDHLAVHEETSIAVRAMGEAAPPLYYVTMAPGAMRAVVQSAVKREWRRPSQGVWTIEPAAFGLGGKPPNLVIDVKPWLARKLAALRCHRSQFGAVSPFSLLDRSEAAEWLGSEYFRRALGAPLREGLLECLIKVDTRARDIGDCDARC